jgi:hypothetical protein
MFELTIQLQEHDEGRTGNALLAKPQPAYEYVVYRSSRHIKVAGWNDFHSPHIKQHSHTSP